jgi:hypothetical protein
MFEQMFHLFEAICGTIVLKAQDERRLSLGIWHTVPCVKLDNGHFVKDGRRRSSNKSAGKHLCGVCRKWIVVSPPPPQTHTLLGGGVAYPLQPATTTTT